MKYLMRNKSVVVKLFQGQLKSTLVCPECKKVRLCRAKTSDVLYMWHMYGVYMKAHQEGTCDGIKMQSQHQCSFRCELLSKNVCMILTVDEFCPIEMYEHF